MRETGLQEIPAAAANFSCRSQNLLFLLKVGVKEQHAANGDQKNDGRGVTRGVLR